METQELAGEYMVPNLREMVTGFLLKPDNSFQFFLTYGALDRYATGQWRREGDTVFFNSGEWSGADFTIVQSEKGDEEDGIMVRLDPPNPMLAAYLLLSLAGGKENSWIQFRGPGELRLEPQAFETLSFQFEFCPERFTALTPVKGHTVFSVRPEQSLFELFLRDFSLQLTGEGMKGRHPMMEGEFEYIRSGK